jgi:transportin-1
MRPSVDCAFRNLVPQYLEPCTIVFVCCVSAGLADGLRASIEPLVAGGPLPTLLLAACGDQSTDVRQSAFALLGDLAKACPR